MSSDKIYGKEVNLSVTLNLGNFNSCKVSVGGTSDVTPYDELYDTVSKELLDKIDKLVTKLLREGLIQDA